MLFWKQVIKILNKYQFSLLTNKKNGLITTWQFWLFKFDLISLVWNTLRSHIGLTDTELSKCLKMCFCAPQTRKQMMIMVHCLRWPQVPVVMTSAVVGPTSGVWSTVWVLSGNLISVTLTYNPGKCILYPDFWKTSNSAVPTALQSILTPFSLFCFYGQQLYC